MNNLVIHRQRWARGKPPVPKRETNFLLGEDGTMCCLGFCLAQMGVPAEHILNVGEPNETAREYEYKDSLMPIVAYDCDDDVDDDGWATETYGDSLLAGNAMSDNDSEELTEREREARITAHFAAAGIEVVFVDTPEEVERLTGMPVGFGR